MIAVDKIGAKVLFLNPVSFETEVVLDGFPRTVHEPVSYTHLTLPTKA